MLYTVDLDALPPEEKREWWQSLKEDYPDQAAAFQDPFYLAMKAAFSASSEWVMEFDSTKRSFDVTCRDCRHYVKNKLTNHGIGACLQKITTRRPTVDMRRYERRYKRYSYVDQIPHYPDTVRRCRDFAGRQELETGGDSSI